MKPGTNPLLHAASATAMVDFGTQVHRAAKGKGADFTTILSKAAGESRLDNSAKNPRSTATGAFQFVERTWLDLVRRHGDAIGRSDLAAAVTVIDGKPTVRDPALRKTILDMRKDPTTAAMMTARYAEENRTALRRGIGRDPAQAELAMAHLLGAHGAIKLLTASPDTPTDQIVAGAVRANPTLFHDATGRVRTAAEARDFLTRKFDAERARAAPQAQLAAAIVQGLEKLDAAPAMV